MRRSIVLGLAIFAGMGIGAVSVLSLHAQTKPPAYVIIDIAEMTDPDGFKGVTSSPGASVARAAELGGRYVVRTETATAVDGTPPTRFVVIAFDNKDKAQSWADAADVKATNTLRSKTTKSRAFIVDGLAN